MWTIETPWFDVAVLMSLFATGSILFGHFEQHKPAWRRLLKPAIFLAVLVALAKTVGRSWAYGVLALLFLAAGTFHFWWLSKHGINAWTGEPQDKYLALVGRLHHDDRACTGGPMADVNDVLAANRAAVIDLVAAAERSAATWTTPRAPGKWSPSQVVEHVARGLEEGANVVSGAPSIPMPPAFLRPLARLFFNRILKKDAFPKGFKANKALDPHSGPATPAEARARLEGAFARFDQECRGRAASGHHVVSTGFGTVSVEDYVRFNAMHTRHHCKQMPGAAILSPHSGATA